jgi:hypothetical protein
LETETDSEPDSEASTVYNKIKATPREELREGLVRADEVLEGLESTCGASPSAEKAVYDA